MTFSFLSRLYSMITGQLFSSRQNAILKRAPLYFSAFLRAWGKGEQYRKRPNFLALAEGDSRMQHNVVKMSIFGGPVEFFGHLLSGQRREVSRLARCATKIKELEASFRSLDDAKLLQLGASLKQRHLAGASLDDLLLECFAAVWEAVWRALRIDTRDVQLMGALAMQNGAIAEMATGEGKSIAALYPAFLQSLSGKGVHVATLNPYLAERDHAQAQSVLNLLGCSCGLLRPGDKPANRRRAYGADVT